MSKAILSGNGSSDWMRMPQGFCLIVATCPSWSTSEVTYDVAINADGDEPEPMYGPDNSTIFTASGSSGRSVMFASDGDMAVRATVANYGGSPVTVRVRQCITNVNNLV